MQSKVGIDGKYIFVLITVLHAWPIALLSTSVGQKIILNTVQNRRVLVTILAQLVRHWIDITAALDSLSVDWNLLMSVCAQITIQNMQNVSSTPDFNVYKLHLTFILNTINGHAGMHLIFEF